MTGAKMQRKNVSSETQWELVLGYSRVVRLGDSVYVSGTTATDKEGNIVGVASTLVGVSRLINPEILVEIEVDAIVNTTQEK